MKYARVLLEHCPDETTKLFIDYYTGRYKPKRDEAPKVIQTPQNGASSAVQNLAALIPLPYMKDATATPTTPASQAPQVIELPATYTSPEPRTAFSSFVDHSAQFIVFLEACLNEEEVKQEDKVDLYTTLFEMYLHAANEKKGEEKQEWETKAKKLIEDEKVSLLT
jgi:vacuolar protein sorting-associated protein 11